MANETKSPLHFSPLQPGDIKCLRDWLEMPGGVWLDRVLEAMLAEETMEAGAGMVLAVDDPAAMARAESHAILAQRIRCTQDLLAEITKGRKGDGEPFEYKLLVTI